MTRRIAWLVAATTSAVVVAFVVPLCFLVANIASDRATTRAREQAQSVARLVATLADPATLQRTVADVSAQGPRVVVVEPDGGLVGEDSLAAGTSAASVERARQQKAAFTVAREGGLDALAPVATDGGLDVVVASVTDDELRAGVPEAWLAIGVLGVALVGISVAAAWNLGRRVSVPVVEVAEVAHRLREGDTSARAVPGGPPETAELGRALNALADRIDDLVGGRARGRRRPRSPPAHPGDGAAARHRPRDRPRGRRPAARSRRAPPAQHRRRRARGPALRDGRARPTDGRRPRRRGPRGVLGAAGRGPGAPARAGRRRVDAAVAMADGDLAELVDTLLDNVFAHTPEGADVRVSVARRAPTGSSSGSRTPARGCRCRGARGHSAGGSTGLGLAIVHRLAEQAGGEVGLGRSDLGGLRVTVALPTVERG